MIDTSGSQSISQLLSEAHTNTDHPYLPTDNARSKKVVGCCLPRGTDVDYEFVEEVETNQGHWIK